MKSSISCEPSMGLISSKTITGHITFGPAPSHIHKNNARFHFVRRSQWETPLHMGFPISSITSYGGDRLNFSCHTMIVTGQSKILTMTYLHSNGENGQHISLCVNSSSSIHTQSRHGISQRLSCATESGPSLTEHNNFSMLSMSAPSEAPFSLIGNIVTKTRVRLSSRTIEMLAIHKSRGIITAEEIRDDESDTEEDENSTQLNSGGTNKLGQPKITDILERVDDTGLVTDIDNDEEGIIDQVEEFMYDFGDRY